MVCLCWQMSMQSLAWNTLMLWPAWYCCCVRSVCLHAGRVQTQRMRQRRRQRCAALCQSSCSRSGPQCCGRALSPHSALQPVLSGEGILLLCWPLFLLSWPLPRYNKFAALCAPQTVCTDFIAFPPAGNPSELYHSRLCLQGLVEARARCSDLSDWGCRMSRWRFAAALWSLLLSACQRWDPGACPSWPQSLTQSWEVQRPHSRAFHRREQLRR